MHPWNVNARQNWKKKDKMTICLWWMRLIMDTFKHKSCDYLPHYGHTRANNCLWIEFIFIFVLINQQIAKCCRGSIQCSGKYKWKPIVFQMLGIICLANDNENVVPVKNLFTPHPNGRSTKFHIPCVWLRWYIDYNTTVGQFSLSSELFCFHHWK